MLGIDTFSGDSIPMHLVTRDALALYVHHLVPDGANVVQATDRCIELVPVIQRLAAEQGMEARLISGWAESQEGVGYWMSATDQVLVTRDGKLLQRPRILEASERITERSICRSSPMRGTIWFGSRSRLPANGATSASADRCTAEHRCRWLR